MLTGEQLAERREIIAGSADLQALQATIVRRAAPLLQRMPVIPPAKALLSADGGLCPQDAAMLEFDPWSPRAHRCARCDREHAGERHDRAWARWQHLWLAERTADLAVLAALDEDAATADRAATILATYAGRYGDYPNRDNVLGPARLFFSTYLESIWLTGYLAAASVLRESGLLDQEVADGVSALADEAAGLIGEFDEGFSNRQTWHNAALAAIAVWFEDEELATRVVEGPTGIIAHLIRGFGSDGMWYEGENYHLFALRGQLLAMGWAAQAGVTITEDSRLAARLAAALRAPALTALPDRTFPARKDSRFGVSLAQPMYLELWEIGLARMGRADDELWGWLAELYRAAPPPPQRFDSYLHDAGLPSPAEPRTRADLSWWGLLEMAPELPPAAPAWRPGSVLMESQGLGILRAGERYASLECGPYGGGHGHPDRLHLTLHAGGVHWLPDPGTGAYVTRDLFWYRSTLAHNAPRVDAASQRPGDARCAAFAESGSWAWVQGEFGPFLRTL
ncbi:MAG TPA: heparinase II/III family protein, partial [Gemmatimonadales bacterium]|nr:heparinase II/III family protein [Gemmatimonadales bacterium]